LCHTGYSGAFLTALVRWKTNRREGMGGGGEGEILVASSYSTWWGGMEDSLILKIWKSYQGKQLSPLREGQDEKRGGRRRAETGNGREGW